MSIRVPGEILPDRFRGRHMEAKSTLVRSWPPAKVGEAFLISLAAAAGHATRSLVPPAENRFW